MEAIFWAVSGAVFVVVWGVIIAVVSHYRSRQRMQEREMLHRERMCALEQGVPFAELPDDGTRWAPPPIDWWGRLLPILARILGFAAVGVGLGLCLAFRLSSDSGFQALWTMGLIPLLGGIGLLLYSLSTRGEGP